MAALALPSAPDDAASLVGDRQQFQLAATIATNWLWRFDDQGRQHAVADNISSPCTSILAIDNPPTATCNWGS